MSSRGWKRPSGLQEVSGTVMTRHGYGIPKKGNEELVDYLKKILTVSPKVNPNAGCGKGATEYAVYEESESRLYLPRAFGMDWFGTPDKDKLGDGALAPGLQFQGSLRPEQVAPAQEFIHAAEDSTRRGGIISIQCGGGKTVLCLYLACYIKRKTLVICHKDFLIKQWRERIEQYIPSAKVGIIKAKKVDVEGKDIVLASLQSLATKEYAPEVLSDFGMVAVDECHHTAAEVFCRALPKVSYAKVFLGLSATLNRADGLRKVFEWYLGRPVYEQKKRNDTQMIVKMLPYYDPNPDYGRERVLWNGKLNTPQMLNAICAYRPRNEMIIEEIKNILEREPERRILILSDRRNHLKTLESMITDARLGTVGYYVGGMKENALKESESKDILLATYSMAAEGMDVPCLNTLILASPVSSIEQPIGRIQRQKVSERKYIPLTIDVWDQFSMFNGQAKRRMAFYKKSGYTIEGEESDEVSEKTDQTCAYNFIEEE